MFSFHAIVSAKKEKVAYESPGAFEEFQNLPYQIWIMIFVSYLLLTTIGIIEKRMNGIPNNVFVCASKNLFLYFGTILGKGFNIPSLSAIRICVGVWLLQLVVLLNLFSGVMKANQINQGTTNINSIEDFLRTRNLVVVHLFTKEFCRSSEKKVTHFCKRFCPNNEPKNRKFVYFVNTAFAIIFHLTAKEYNFIKDFHFGSSKYNYKPAVYMIKNTVHPEALKLINKRVASFFETSQFIPTFRYVEMLFEADSENTKMEKEFRKIEMKGFGTMFALWSALLSVISVVTIVEIIINRDLYDTSIV